MLVSSRKSLLIILSILGLAGCNSDAKRVMDTSGQKNSITSPAPGPETPITEPGLNTPGVPNDIIIGGDGTEYTRPQLEEELGVARSRTGEITSLLELERIELENILSEFIVTDPDPQNSIDVELREANRKKAVDIQARIITLELELAGFNQRIAEIDFLLGGDPYDLIYWTNFIDELEAEVAALEALSIFIDDEDRRETGEKTIDALASNLADIESLDHPDQSEIDDLNAEIEILISEVEALESQLDDLESSFEELLAELNAKSNLTSEEVALKQSLEIWVIKDEALDNQQQLVDDKQAEIESKLAEISALEDSYSQYVYEIQYRTNLITATLETKDDLETELGELFDKPNKTQEDFDRIDEIDAELISLTSYLDYLVEKKEIAEAAVASYDDDLALLNAQKTVLYDELEPLEDLRDVLQAEESTARNDVNSNIGNVEDSFTQDIDDKNALIESKQVEVDNLQTELEEHEALVTLYQFMIDLYVDLFGNN